MTFCLIMKTQEGLVGIADTRITSGAECLSAKKITVRQAGKRHSMFLMTSGLRSVRDKAVTYFQELLETEDNSTHYNKLYKLVNAFADQVRRVAIEDKTALRESGLHFNLYALIAGQLEDDEDQKAYLLYPEGNWIEIGEGSPYSIIGNSFYGRPILDRALKYSSSIEYALKAGFLAFNATSISATDVGYPIDVAIMKKGEFNIIEQRYEHEDLRSYSKWWQEHVINGIKELPGDWIKPILERSKK